MKIYNYWLVIIISILFFNNLLLAQCTITATSSGGNTSYTQVYVLVDASGNIVAQNTTGSFANTAPGVYHVHALNYNPANPPSPLPSALIGQPVSLVGSTTAGCFNSNFLTDYVARACNTCLKTTTACSNAPIIATSSNSMAGYTQMYVLVNARTGLVEATNGTGNFTGMVTAGNSYEVHALNYQPSSPPNPLPVVGQAVANVGTTSAGCYNSDFLSDYVCFNITNCATSCYKSMNVCTGTNIVATSSGNNSSYTQVYILADASGNLVAQNSTGVFSTATFAQGQTYTVHAINYNPSEPPSPLPSALAVGASLLTITGGCYNLDFINDYVCVNIVCPTILDADILKFEGQVMGANNELSWVNIHENNLAYYTLERSADAQHYSPVFATAANGSIHYDYLDTNPLTLGYYRLKMVRLDGSFKYSNVIALEHKRSKAQDWNIFPNPNSGTITIEFEVLFADKPMTIKLFDMLGRELKNVQFTAQEGINRQVINLEDCASGMYLVGLDTGNDYLVRKIVKL